MLSSEDAQRLFFLNGDTYRRGRTPREVFRGAHCLKGVRFVRYSEAQEQPLRKQR